MNHYQHNQSANATMHEQSQSPTQKNNTPANAQDGGPERHIRTTAHALAAQRHATTTPAIPDGGYGWFVAIVAFYIKNLVAGIPTAYGLLLMFSTLETDTMLNAGQLNLWTNTILRTPLSYIAAQALFDPICIAIVRNSKWPRLTALCGVCLLCASFLMIWLTVVNGTARATLQVCSGLFAGFGSALVLHQINVLIAQYFRLKLPAIETLLRLAEFSGIIYTALLVGRYMCRYGVPHAIICYHLLLLTTGILVLVFKKPAYLKCKQVYRIMPVGQHEEEDDEEDVFSKTTELQSPHTSLPPVLQDARSMEGNQTTQNWVTFDDDQEHDGLPTPRELFTDGSINNNITYSFENVDNAVVHNTTDDTTNIFLPIPKPNKSYAFIYNASFYSNCILNVAVLSSTFIFVTLFPSYLYYSVSFLRKESIGHIISIIYIACLIEACFIGCWKFSRANSKFPIAMLLWLSAIGHFLISDWKKEMFIVIGGILITTSTCALEFLTKSSSTSTMGRSKLEHAATKFICALSIFLFFFFTNPPYENCFRFVGLLQFSTGCINFCNFVYNKISRLY